MPAIALCKPLTLAFSAQTRGDSRTQPKEAGRWAAPAPRPPTHGARHSRGQTRRPAGARQAPRRARARGARWAGRAGSRCRSAHGWIPGGALTPPARSAPPPHPLSAGANTTPPPLPAADAGMPAARRRAAPPQNPIFSTAQRRPSAPLARRARLPCTKKNSAHRAAGAPALHELGQAHLLLLRLLVLLALLRARQAERLSEADRAPARGCATPLCCACAAQLAAAPAAACLDVLGDRQRGEVVLLALHGPEHRACGARGGGRRVRPGAGGQAWLALPGTAPPSSKGRLPAPARPVLQGAESPEGWGAANPIKLRAPPIRLAKSVLLLLHLVSPGRRLGRLDSPGVRHAALSLHSAAGTSKHRVAEQDP